MQIPFTIKNETIYLIADDANYSLARVKERNRDGEVVPELESFKWFANLGSALNRIVDLKVKSSDAKNILELKQVIEAVQTEVRNVWQTRA